MARRGGASEKGWGFNKGKFMPAGGGASPKGGGASPKGAGPVMSEGGAKGAWRRGSPSPPPPPSPYHLY